MFKFSFGVCIIVLGLVHLAYFGQSQGVWTLQTGAAWPQGSWVVANLLDARTARLVASGASFLAALGYLFGGLGMFAEGRSWRLLVGGAGMLSTTMFVMYWDGGMQHLNDQGGIVVLANLAVMVAVLILRWPDFRY